MKKIVLSLLMIAMLSVTVTANSSTFLANVSSSRIIVEGTVDLPYAFDVSIYLLKPTYTLDDVTASNFKTVVQSLKQVEVIDGKFNAEFLMDDAAETGMYNLYMSAYGISNVQTATVYFMGINGQNDFLSTFNTGTISQLETLFSENNANACAAMGLRISEFLSLPQTVKTIIIETIIENRTYTKDNVSVLFNDLTIAATVETASFAQIDVLLGKYQRDIALGTEIESVIFTSKSAGIWNNALAVLANEKFATIDNLKSVIKSSIAVGAINSALDYIQITDIIKDNRSTLGISQNSRYWDLDSNGKRDVNLALFNKNFAKLSDFAIAFNNAVEAVPTNTPVKTGGGSVGGGGSPSVQVVVNNSPEILQNEPFLDISSVPWAKDSIIYLTGKGIVSGTGDGSFSPNDGVTREQFVKMLVNAGNLFNKNEKCDFNDVPQDAWFYKFVASGVKAGIANGISNDLFGSGQEITRQDVAVMASRLIKIYNVKIDKPNIVKFADESDTADYAVESVKALTGAGILNGMENGSFVPYGVCTRAQAAKIIYGIMQKLPLY